MGAEQDLIQKLMISKQIMDKHNGMNRNQMQGNVLSSPMVEEYSPVQANYNLPSDLLSEASATPTKVNTELPTSDRILNSRLPDDIKKLMMEHPISQPQQLQPTISDELIEKASRLMKKGNDNNYIPESAKANSKSTVPTNIDYNVIKKLQLFPISY